MGGKFEKGAIMEQDERKSFMKRQKERKIWKKLSGGRKERVFGRGKKKKDVFFLLKRGIMGRKEKVWKKNRYCKKEWQTK